MSYDDDAPTGWVIGDIDDLPNSDGWHPRRGYKRANNPVVVAVMIGILILYNVFFIDHNGNDDDDYALFSFRTTSSNTGQR